MSRTRRVRESPSRRIGRIVGNCSQGGIEGMKCPREDEPRVRLDIQDPKAKSRDALSRMEEGLDTVCAINC